ncbi:hypothetical protein IWQ61_005886 [Dispira simplex]|nr:hypothetical protein IWQ61_005886 [Dispira simplex]
MTEIQTFTASQVNAHNKKSDLWCILSGKVYDVTKFVDEHPGGEEVLLEHAGLDCTEAFEDVGHSEDARDLLAEYYVGDLEGSSEPAGPPKPTSRKENITTDKSSDSNMLTYMIPIVVFIAFLAYKLYV